MAHFIGGVRGSRNETTRLGTKQSGIQTWANGWEIGGRISVRHSAQWEEDRKDWGNPQDTVSFSLTAGSNGSQTDFFLGSFTRKDLDDLKKGRKEFRLVDKEE